MQVAQLQRNIKLFYISEFCQSLLFIIPVWVAYYRQHLSFTEMSIMTSVSLIITIALELPTGAFADLVGRKTSVILGLLIHAVGYLTLALANSAGLIVTGAILSGIGAAFTSGSNIALMYDSLKESNQTQLFAKIRSKSVLYFQVGLIVSSILAGYLYEFWQGLPFVLTGIAWIVAAASYTYMTEPALDSEKFSLTNYLAQTRLGIRELFKNPYIARLSLFYSLVGGITWAWQVYFNQIYASAVGFSEVDKSWLFGIIRFVNAIVLIKIFHADRLVSKKNVFLLFPLLIIMASLPTLFTSQLIGMALLFLMTMGSTARFIVLDKYVNDEFDSKYRATAISMLNMLVSLVQVIMILISGPIMDRWSVSVVYIGVGLLTLVTLLPLGWQLTSQQKQKLAL